MEKKSKSFLEPKNFKSEYTEYGKKTEKEAREVLQEALRCNIIETGLVIAQQNPWIACSPDGIIFENGKPSILVEIKCPVKGQTLNIYSAMELEFGKCLDFSQELVQLKKKHKYYAQIQLGMVVLNVKKCFFMMYASFDKSFHIICVDFDREFIVKMLSSLKIVYFNILIHEICISYKENESNNNNNVMVSSSVK